MRFLVVYQDFSAPAQKLVEHLRVEDVCVLLVRKNEREASADVLKALAAHRDAPTAVCQVVRTFKKSIEKQVCFEISDGDPHGGLFGEFTQE